jgi:hypothetical protein
LSGNGTVVTVPQGSDEANAELIAVLMTTIAGERVFYPTFGITDPVGGAGIDPSEVSAKVAQFGPFGVTIDNISITWTAEHQSKVLIEFT